MDSNLLRAILAMDAYNQGYDAGVVGVGNNIGNAMFLRDAVDATVFPEGTAQAASFYAVAYTVGTETIISYRGTDSLIFDPFTGWPVAFGSTTSSQAAAASPSDNAPLILARAG